MAKVEFEIPHKLLEGLNNKEISSDEFITSVLYLNTSGKNHNLENLKEQLVAFHSGDGGSPEIENVKVVPEKCEYDDAKLIGKVTFNYIVHYFYGCSGIDRKDDDHETANFEIGPEHKKLIIHIHDNLVRDTYEEF